MSQKNWGGIFGSAAVAFLIMIVLAFISNPLVPVICLGISILVFVLARIIEMDCVDIWIIWICCIVSIFFAIFG